MKQVRMILGRLLIALGGLLILSALLLLGYNQKLQKTAREASDATLVQVQQEIKRIQETREEGHRPTEPLEVDGLPYFGVLEIPGLSLTLPVQADWSYDKLLSTPCVYSGSIQDGELVILAHNYRAHFRRINSLQQGDEILLTDASGRQFHYAVEEVSVLEAANVEEMINSGYDLSLFTCTYGGKARVTVRCTLQNKIDRYPVIDTSTPELS